MLKSPAQSRTQGPTTYLVPSHGAQAGPSYTVPRQPFSILFGRHGQIEIAFDQRASAAKPVISTSHAERYPAKRDERTHDSRTKYPSPPRSDVATVGSSTYRHAPSPTPQYTHSPHHSHSGGHEHKSTPKHSHHELASSSKSPQVSSRVLLPTGNATEDRHHHKSSPRLVKANIPAVVPRAVASSPQKHAHFSLPQSMPVKATVQEPAPGHVSRHHHSQSLDSYFHTRPRGWYNRRGDQFIQRGVIKRQPQHLEWHPVFASYPEPGTGWMNEERHFLPPGGGILKHS